MPISVMPMPAAICAGLAGCSREAHGANSKPIPATATIEPHSEAEVGTLAEHCPAEQAAGDQQQSEHGRDDARGDALLGQVNGVEVDAELRESEERGAGQWRRFSRVQAFPLAPAIIPIALAEMRKR